VREQEKIMTPTERSFLHLGPDGFHRVAYREWGDPACTDVVICVHGVSRNGRDFDDLAQALSKTRRVLCADMPGRGKSEWLDDKTQYVQSLYVSVCSSLMALSGAVTLDYVGTSMGGRIGMRLAAARGTPIRKLVINDIGPHVSQDGRKDNFKHFGTDPRFASESEGMAFVRETRAAFGPTTEAAWEKFSRDSLRPLPDGQWSLHYDPGLAVVSGAAGADTWEEWERITCPTMVLWGMKSRLLLEDTVRRMNTTGPCATVFEVPYAGHCPRLENAEQIGAVCQFLDR
jgi:pimeloyl-ACP methyl ester carboxylesterase